jgi:CDP-4-dehydro-6-deoxyglucose reductase, E1
VRKEAIQKLVKQYGPEDPKIIEHPDGIPLAVPSFGAREIEEAIDTLLSGWITMGDRVFGFEKAWADYIGTKHAVAVNSGSSALLVMLCAMVECGDLRPHQNVIVPAVGWSTTLCAVSQANLTPVIMDVDENTLCLQGKFSDPVLTIHMLGASSRVESPLVMEDACGAHGAMIANQKVGSIGECGAFSFFFSHHISTGEGGMITTDRDDLADACRSIRAHGWIRERSDRNEWINKYPNLDDRFLFATPGYNLRMTEVSGAFGLHQVPRLEGFVQQRRNNHQRWCQQILDLSLPVKVFPEQQGTRHSAFAFPILLQEDSPISRTQLCQFLEAKGIKTRPISGANLAMQPMFEKIPRAIVRGELTVATAIQKRGFFVGQSHSFGHAHGDLLAAALKEAFLSV